MVQFNKRACQQVNRLTKTAFLGMLEDGSTTKNFFESMDDDDWDVLSFNPEIGEVCTVIFGPPLEKTVTVTVVSPSASSL